MVKIDIKNLGIGLFFSVVIITILNLLVAQLFPSVPILKTGVALILIMVGIALTLVFVFAADKKITNQEIIMFFAILITMFIIYYVTNRFAPEIFSILPESTKQVLNTAFSSIN